MAAGPLDFGGGGVPDPSCGVGGRGPSRLGCPALWGWSGESGFRGCGGGSCLLEKQRGPRGLAGVSFPTGLGGEPVALGVLSH